MPVYEYECQDCNKRFEAIQSIKDKPLKTCKFCEGNVRRLISQSSFALKGGGWYQDGYHKPNPGEKKGTQESKGPKTPDKKKAKPADSSS